MWLCTNYDKTSDWKVQIVNGAKPMTTILAVVGDLHVNSAVALCPEQMARDDGPTILPSKSQLWLRAQWLQFWQDVATAKAHYHADVVAVINGDWGDVNKHSPYQLLSPNTDDVLNWMQETVVPLRKVADRVFVVRGTEAHTGGVGWIENRAAQEIKAEPDPNTGNPSWWVLRAEFDGVRVLITHHPGTNSTRPWTRGGAANRAAAMVMDAHYSSDWKPQLAVFAHVHHNEDSFDNHPVRAIFNRSWTLADAYSHRSGFGIRRDSIGGMVVLCDAGQYKVVKRVYRLPEAHPWQN